MQTAFYIALCLSPVFAMALVAWWISHRKRKEGHCPACGHSGYVFGLGHFECAECGRRFVLDSRGRVSPSIWTAVRLSIIRDLLLITLIAVLCWRLGEFWFLGLFLVSAAVGFQSQFKLMLQTKKFPNADAR
jgi:hypothetical protein